jgi:hypothetical protein
MSGESTSLAIRPLQYALPEKPEDAPADLPESFSELMSYHAVQTIVPYPIAGHRIHVCQGT